MATYVLIPGAGSDAWYWHRVRPELEALGHTVITPDLPVEDEAAGLEQYADAVVEAIGPHRELILVAQSMGGFTAPLVADRVPVDLIVMLAAMTPAPGESPGDWWANTGFAEARAELDRSEGRDPDAPFDVMVTFFHDVPRDVVEDSRQHQRGQAGKPFEEPWPLERWPDVPTRFLLCRDDRFFPAEFQRRVVKERLGITPDEMEGGHLPALHSPHALVGWLEEFRRDLQL